MTAEPLGENTYKITLDKAEASAMPPEDNNKEMRRFICGLIDRLAEEQSIDVPDGRLLTEVFLRSDGSCVFFITALEQNTDEHEPRFYSCDVAGMERLRGLCGALSRKNASCAVYCDSSFCGYRLIFADPPQYFSQICAEFGDYNEITRLFVSRTEEYLTELSPYGDIRPLADLLG